MISILRCAQDGAATPNVITNPAAGAVATNVNPGHHAASVAEHVHDRRGVLRAYQRRHRRALYVAHHPGGIFEALNAGALTGNLILNLTSDLLAATGTARSTSWRRTEVGGYTVTIQPGGGAARAISGSNTTVLINLNGADRVTFDGLNTGGNALLVPERERHHRSGLPAERTTRRTTRSGTAPSRAATPTPAARSSSSRSGVGTGTTTTRFPAM